MPLVSLADLKGQKFEPFLIIGDIKIDIDEENRTLRVKILDLVNPITEKNGRKELEASGKWRWAAGGCAYVLELSDMKVLVTIFRDGGAPSYPLHNTLSSGLSACLEELFNPKLTALREALEEILIFDRKTDKQLVPNLGQSKWGEGYLKPNVQTDDLTEYLDTWAVIVYQPNGKKINFNALVNLDKSTGGIDVLFIKELDLTDYTLDGIYIKDGEMDGKLDRVIELFKVTDNEIPILTSLANIFKGYNPGLLDLGAFVAAFKSGERVEPEFRDEFRFTPPLQEVINALKGDVIP